MPPRARAVAASALVDVPEHRDAGLQHAGDVLAPDEGDEFNERVKRTMFVSATPSQY